MPFRIKDGFMVSSTDIVNNSGQLLVYQKDTTTIGQNLSKIPDVSAISFIRINADETVSALEAADFRTAIGAGTSSTTGTVTSVALTAPTSLFTISGSPVTTSGTLDISLAAQAPNYVFAGPSSGTTAAAPIFRPLAVDDIPTTLNELSLSNLTVTGNLIVNGTTTTINSTIVTVDDSTLQLGGDTSLEDPLSKATGIYSLWGGTTIPVTSVVANGSNNLVEVTFGGVQTLTLGDTVTVTGATGTEQSKFNGTWKLLNLVSGRTYSVQISSIPAAGTYTTNLGAWVRSHTMFMGYRPDQEKFYLIPRSQQITVSNISGTAGTLVASLEGNASTASAWQTARTITIGSTGKTVNGSANVSWTLSEIGAAATNQTFFLGNTQIAINRQSDEITLTGIEGINYGTNTTVAPSSLFIRGGDWAAGTLDLQGDPVLASDLYLSGGRASTTISGQTLVGGDVIIDGGGIELAGTSTGVGGKILIGTLSNTNAFNTSEIVIGKSGVPIKMPGLGTSGFLTLTTGGQLVASQSGNTVIEPANITTVNATVIDTWATATFRSAEYFVQITQSAATAEYYIAKILVVHNGTTTTMTEYGVLETGTIPVTLTTDISGGNVRLIATITDANTRNASIKLLRNLVAV